MTNIKALSNTAHVYIDVNLIPQHTQENLARATLDAFLRFMERPDARKILDEEKAELDLSMTDG